MTAVDEVSRLTERYDLGLLDRRDLLHSLRNALLDAAEANDETVAAAVAAAILCPPLYPDDVVWLISTADDIRRRTWTAHESPETHLGLAVEALRERGTAILASASPEDVVGFVGALRPAWVHDDWLELALRSVGECDDPARAARDLLGVGVWRHGRRAMARFLVDPFLAVPTRGSVELAARALATDAVEPARHAELERHVLTHAVGDEDDLASLATRWSIEARDRQAVALARRIVAGGTDLSHAGPIVATVLWIGGDRAAAAELAAQFVPDGWGSTARASLCAFILARETGTAESIRALVRRDQEYRAGIPSVGALVGRLAQLQWRASIELGDEQQAIGCAAAVVQHHGFRGYDLHLQGYGQEFDPRLLDRLAVTPDEVLEAREFLARRGIDADDVTVLFSEGKVYYGHGEGGWRV